MTCTLHVAWDERLAGDDFGPGHPMAPIRLKLTTELARAFGLGHLDGVEAAFWDDPRVLTMGCMSTRTPVPRHRAAR